MKKSDLSKMRLPDAYEDCSSWFEEGLDSVPSLLDFLRAGRTEKEYEKFQKLHAIESMKKYLKEAGSEDDAENAKGLIEEKIQEYNKML